MRVADCRDLCAGDRLGNDHQARRTRQLAAQAGDALSGIIQRVRRTGPDYPEAGARDSRDADSGRVLWKYDADTSMVASVTPTAGGLVLRGDTKRNFIAFDAKNGRVLLKKNLGDPIGGGIVTYEIGGVQHVAVAGGMKNTVTQQTDSGPAWVAILALPKP